MIASNDQDTNAFSSVFLLLIYYFREMKPKAGHKNQENENLFLNFEIIGYCLY